MNERGLRYQAQRSFDDARRRAQREQWRNWISGQKGELIPFEVVRSELRQQNPCFSGVQLVPLDKIIGSVGRYNDFTRQFLPLNDNMRERWIQVKSFGLTKGWPPAELYQVGDVYFVKDGNHRVAIARQMGNDTIEAYVWHYPETVEITTANSLNEILLRLGASSFLEETKLDDLYPDHNIRFTVAGQYQCLLAQISQLQRNLALIDVEEVEGPDDISYEEAVCFWYDVIYLPAVEIIRASGIMENFPGRTEADLYVWFLRYRHQLQEQFGETHIASLMKQAVEENQPSGLGKVVNGVLKLFGSQPAEPLDLE